MMTEQTAGWGLGVELAPHGQTIEFRHGGSGGGYKALIISFLGPDVGLAVLTNSDGGGAIREELVRAVAEEYAWPAYRDTASYTLDTSIPEDALRDLQGSYRWASGLTSDVVYRDGDLHTRFNGGQWDRLFPLSATDSISLDDVTYRFTRGADGILTLRYSDASGTYEARRQDP